MTAAPLRGAQRVLVINGHPDPRPERLCAALARAYEDGARQAGREVRRIDVGALEFDLIRTAAAFTDGEPGPAIAEAQNDVLWADHMVIVHPLWLGSAPALLKAFFEQVFRYGFAIPDNGAMRGLLSGRSARMVVTMGMPAPAYRWLFGAFGVRGLERSVLRLAGIRPIRRTLLGMVERSAAQRADWIERLRRLGAEGR